MGKDKQRYLKVKFEHEELEEIIANNPIINEWRMVYVEKVVPPTEEEVCKALSEYLKEKVTYSKQFGFVSNNRVIICLYPGNVLHFANSYPAHIHSIVGRFYEGVSGNE